MVWEHGRISPWSSATKQPQSCLMMSVLAAVVPEPPCSSDSDCWEGEEKYKEAAAGLHQVGQPMRP